MFNRGDVVKLKNVVDGPIFTVITPSSTHQIGVECEHRYTKGQLIRAHIPDLLLEVVPNGGYPMRKYKFTVQLEAPENISSVYFKECVANVIKSIPERPTAGGNEGDMGKVMFLKRDSVYVGE